MADSLTSASLKSLSAWSAWAAITMSSKISSSPSRVRSLDGAFGTRWIETTSHEVRILSAKGAQSGDK